MKKPLVSIIIPFYNEEKYLDRAINSAINQSYKNIEIILVDDGSVDTSKDIAKQFALNYKNVFLITNTKNQSLGFSRNKGVVLANGKYITFLDADDEFRPEMIDILLKKSVEKNSDIVICKFDIIDSKGSYVSTQGFKNVYINLSTEDAVLGMYNYNIASPVWAKLFKTEIAKNIAFVEGLWFEDKPYLLGYFLESTQISFVEKSLLKIHSRSESITRRIIEAKRIKDVFEIYKLEVDIVLKSSTIKSKLINQTITSHYIRSLIDTFIILEIDKNKCLNFDGLKTVFLTYLDYFLNFINQQKIELNFKDKIVLSSLKLIKVVGWKPISFSIKLYYNKKYLIISDIKNS